MNAPGVYSKQYGIVLALNYIYALITINVATESTT